MDLSLESALGEVGGPGDKPGWIAGRPLEEWNAAYSKVENYFHALRVRNKVLLGRLVIHVLKRAMRRAPGEINRTAAELSAEEMDRVVAEWFDQVLQDTPATADPLLTTRGRLALLLADMPGKWQEQFLRPGPWPPEFLSAMRANYLRAGPDFQLSKMTPRAVHFGPMTTLARMRRLPFAKMILIWLVFGLILVLVFLRVHR
jgi:hypothetical protein